MFSYWQNHGFSTKTKYHIGFNHISVCARWQVELIRLKNLICRPPILVTNVVLLVLDCIFWKHAFKCNKSAIFDKSQAQTKCNFVCLDDTAGLNLSCCTGAAQWSELYRRIHI